MVADLHALMGEYENPENIRKNSVEMVIDWLACGIDPQKSVIFVQSDVVEHAELAVLLGMITPLGWLERNPTYKEQLREIEGRDLTSYGFLGYPVLQASDILLYKADKVPVGEDQLAHLELTREIVRRFHSLYKKQGVFVEPESLLTKEARILGTDRRKMSKSYGNAINLSDTEADLRKKIQMMITDPTRIKLTDPGHPEVCNVYSYYNILSKDAALVPAVYDWCSNAKKGCTDCKKGLADVVVEALGPITEKRCFIEKEIRSNPSYISDILRAGKTRAQAVAGRTLAEVKSCMGLGQ